MKKILYIFMAVMVLGVSSCEDMLESESTRQGFEPDLNSKTDSVFYMAGILNAMQQLADAYVLQNEMRGDLASLTAIADTNLTYLRSFDYSPSTVNKYDSAYVYYRVINNCNYYIAHRDTTLKTGNTAVAIPEYAAVLSIRAWAYLQAVRQYGKVRFFTEPLTKISQVDNYEQYPFYDINGVADEMIASLLPYSGTELPDYQGSWTFGSLNYGSTKNVAFKKLMIPVDLMLGELYLEKGDYPNAARYLFKFLLNTHGWAGYYYTPFSDLARQSLEDANISIPTTFDSYAKASAVEWYSTIFGSYDASDVITYIPSGVNYQRGVTSELPGLFGYNYYAIDIDSVINGKIQITPSKTYYNLADSCEYYYINRTSADMTDRLSFTGGDQRRWALQGRNGINLQDTCVYFRKCTTGYIYLYRYSTVYLHLAEAFNRMGYPDAAFAVLKDGLSNSLLTTQENIKEYYLEVKEYYDYLKGLDDPSIAEAIKPVYDVSVDLYENKKYLRDETIALLRTPDYGFGYEEYVSQLPYNYGIHQHGCSDCNGANLGTQGVYSKYQYKTEVARKLNELAAEYGLTIGATAEDTLKAHIDAVEDLICDEYALEATLEGTRFSDLSRIARHKNLSHPSTYPSNYGSIWFDRKIKKNRSDISKDLTIEDNWYLPFK